MLQNDVFIVMQQRKSSTKVLFKCVDGSSGWAGYSKVGGTSTAGLRYCLMILNLLVGGNQWSVNIFRKVFNLLATGY